MWVRPSVHGQLVKMLITGRANDRNFIFLFLSTKSYVVDSQTNRFFLAHQIGISVVFTYVYLIHTSPRERWKTNSRTLGARRSVKMLKWRHHVASQRIQGFLEVFFQVFFFQYKGGIKRWARKKTHNSFEDGIEKSVPRDHRLSSLGKPRDANRWSSGWIFLSHPHTYDRF